MWVDAHHAIYWNVIPYINILGEGGLITGIKQKIVHKSDVKATSEDYKTSEV